MYTFIGFSRNNQTQVSYIRNARKLYLYENDAPDNKSYLY